MSQDNKNEITTFNYDLKFKLFDDMIMPYYSLSVQKQKVLSGTLESNDSTTNTVGLIFNRLPYQVRGEYSVNESNDPYKTWKAEIMYARPLDPTFNMYASARYSHTTFPNTALTENLAGGNINVSKRFPAREIYLSLGAGYSRSWGSSITSQDYSLNSEVSWYLGKTVLLLGAQLTYANSEGSGIMDKNSTEHYYFKLKRNLF